MKITTEEVQNIANLARLDLSAEELASLTGQLDQILSYVTLLNELNTEGIAPTTHAIAVENAFRPDELKASLTQEEALANGPQVNGEAFVVPRVI